MAVSLLATCLNVSGATPSPTSPGGSLDPGTLITSITEEHQASHAAMPLWSLGLLFVLVVMAVTLIVTAIQRGRPRPGRDEFDEDAEIDGLGAR